MKKEVKKRNVSTATSVVPADLAARAEIAMMGVCVPVGHQTEVQPMLNYICKTLKVDIPADSDLKDVVNNRIKRYTSTNEVAFMTVNTLRTGDRVVSFALRSTSTDAEERYPDPFTEDYGTGYPCAFIYGLNLDADEMCSEFGDAFFEKHGDFYKRVS